MKPDIRFDDGLNFKKTKGLMLYGTIGENAKEIIIKLSQKKEGEPDGYIGVLQLEIGIKQKYYKLSDGVCVIIMELASKFFPYQKYSGFVNFILK